MLFIVRIELLRGWILLLQEFTILIFAVSTRCSRLNGGPGCWLWLLSIQTTIMRRKRSSAQMVIVVIVVVDAIMNRVNRRGGRRTDAC